MTSASVIQVHDNISPVVISAPHGGLLFPARDYLPTGLLSIADMCDQVRQLADFGIGDILDGICQHLRGGQVGMPSTVSTQMSRMWVDIERYPDAREEMNAVGMGVIYEKDAYLRQLYAGNPPRRDYRLRVAYGTYHCALTTAVHRALKVFPRALFIDLHSYATTALPYELHSADRRPGIVIGVNGDDLSTRAASALSTVLNNDGRDVGINETFKGSLVPNNLSLPERPRLASVMIEIRKDQYLAREGVRPYLDAIAAHTLALTLASGIVAALKSINS